MVQQNGHFVGIIFKPCWLSLQNISDLAGLEMKLSQTWSKHEPNMVPQIRYFIDSTLDHVETVLKISEL